MTKKQILMISIGSIVALGGIIYILVIIRSRSVDNDLPQRISVAIPSEPATSTSPTENNKSKIEMLSLAEIKTLSETGKINKEQDGDRDGLSDTEEATNGTNAAKPDTDEDGITDGEEVFMFKTDPRKPNTEAEFRDAFDKFTEGAGMIVDWTSYQKRIVSKGEQVEIISPEPEGVTRASQDSDSDGLTDLEERALNTNSANPDTDGDGIVDGDEVHKYKTNPLSKDTDGDGFGDAEEIKNGYNPLGAGKCMSEGCIK